MKTRSCDEYLGLRAMRMGSGEVSTLSNFVACTVLSVRMVKSRICAGHVARREECRSAFKILTGKPSGKRLRKV